MPEYGFYEGHLNCYNRDAWSDEGGEKEWNIKGIAESTAAGMTKYESGMATGYRLSEGQHSESLNGEGPKVAAEHYPENVDAPYEYSARAVLDQYVRYDMPLGYFLPMMDMVGDMDRMAIMYKGESMRMEAVLQNESQR